MTTTIRIGTRVFRENTNAAAPAADNAATNDWRHQSACRDEDPELFFPIGTSGPALIQTDRAKAVCRRCPVTGECLQWALDSGQDAGIWGGMSEHERRAVKRRGGLRILNTVRT